MCLIAQSSSPLHVRGGELSDFFVMARRPSLWTKQNDFRDGPPIWMAPRSLVSARKKNRSSWNSVWRRKYGGVSIVTSRSQCCQLSKFCVEIFPDLLESTLLTILIWTFFSWSYIQTFLRKLQIWHPCPCNCHFSGSIFRLICLFASRARTK